MAVRCSRGGFLRVACVDKTLLDEFFGWTRETKICAADRPYLRGLFLMVQLYCFFHWLSYVSRLWRSSGLKSIACQFPTGERDRELEFRRGLEPSEKEGMGQRTS